MMLGYYEANFCGDIVVSTKSFELLHTCIEDANALIAFYKKENFKVSRIEVLTNKHFSLFGSYETYKIEIYFKK